MDGILQSGQEMDVDYFLEVSMNCRVIGGKM